MAKQRIDLWLGWENPSIEEQLTHQGLTLGEFEQSFEKARQCILYLEKTNIMSESDITKTFNKLGNEISKKVKRL